MMCQRFLSRLEYWVRANQIAWAEIVMQKSWIRSLRLAKNLKGVDMAKRMGVSPARISMMESDEARGALTLNMMRKAAQALDCEFVYAVIPKNALKNDKSDQAKKPRIRVDQGYE